MSATDTVIQRKRKKCESGSRVASSTTALITSNQEMEDIMKIVKYLEESGLLIKGIKETIKKKQKKKKRISSNVIKNISY